MKAEVKVARRGKVLTPSKFRNYDLCINPYVGCEFGCKYCYVRFFVTDPDKEWGEFVRRRDHIAEQLPKDIRKDVHFNEQRVVIGTMTDPYQPLERKARLTRTVLETLIENQPAKTGIFTRSPIVLDDLDLIRQLQDPHVHITLTPYPREVLKAIEPIPVLLERRLRTIETITKHDIYVHANVSPVMPIYSERYTAELAQRLANCGIREFYVDPMQTYKASVKAIDDTLAGSEDWRRSREIMTDKERYKEWKEDYKNDWLAAWAAHGNPNVLAIFLDHQSHTALNLRTRKPMSWTNYEEEP